MRRLAALFLIAALLPASAQAQAQHDEGVTVKPRPMQVFQQPRRAATPMPWVAEAPPPAVVTLNPQAPPAEPRQCGMYCAQSYYFCLSRDQGEDCGSDWSQCRANCSPASTPDWRGAR